MCEDDRWMRVENDEVVKPRKDRVSVEIGPQDDGGFNHHEQEVCPIRNHRLWRTDPHGGATVEPPYESVNEFRGLIHGCFGSLNECPQTSKVIIDVLFFYAEIEKAFTEVDIQHSGVGYRDSFVPLTHLIDESTTTRS